MGHSGETRGPDEAVRELGERPLLLLVVGAHLEAEVSDRIFAYRLRERILSRPRLADEPPRLLPVVLSDLWYLNSDSLRRRPAIAIGRPEINAATAYLAGRLPTAFVLEDRFRIQVDPEFIEPRACFWGTTPKATGEALDFFVERYLDAWLDNVELTAAG